MRTGKPQTMPARLKAGRRRFEQWRRTRNGHSRIPERLWTSAVKLATAYGLCRTARALGLDYNALKKRVHSAEAHDSPEPKTAMTFVELPPLGRSGSPECLVELEAPGGAKMRIHLTSGPTCDVVTAISRVFVDAGS